MVNAAPLKLAPPSWIDAFAAGESAEAEKTLREVITDVIAYVTPLYDGKTLANGEPVLTHVMGAAPLLAELHLGHEAIAAELLWPALEQDAATAKRVRDKFGSTIADLAEGVMRMSAMRELGALSSRRAGNRKRSRISRAGGGLSR